MIFDYIICSLIQYTRNGRARGAGIYFLLPCIDDINIVDLRTVTCLVDPQEILTKVKSYELQIMNKSIFKL